MPPGQSWPDLPRPALELSARPRKYGFHGTLKPPFVLAEGRSVAGLHAAIAAMAPRLPRLRLEGMRLAALGRFLALIPEGDTGPIDDLAAALVETLDGFRAPPETSEAMQRRTRGLTPRQDALLSRWGYPYVMEEFQFHITLTGPLEDEERAQTAAALEPLFKPLLERPFRIDDICLFGEGQDGMFRNLHRYTLTG